MEKRERKRIIEEMLTMECKDVEGSIHVEESMEEPFMNPEVPVESSTAIPPVKTYRSIGVQVDIKPPSSVKGTNCRMRSSVRSKGIQCNVPVFNSSILTSTPVKKPATLSMLSEDYESDSEQSEHSEETDDMWKLETSYDTSYDETITEDLEEAETKTRMFAVTEDKLLQLFRRCHRCGLGGASGMVTSVDGTLVRVEQICLACEELFVWKGQQMTGKYPAGNIALSSAILCAGALPGQTLRVLKFWGLEAIAPVTYFCHQKKFLHQAVRNVWQVQQQHAMDKIRDVVLLSGDSRCDSMGHCAKYGSYTLHDTKENKIVCTELIQSTEVKSSYHMELEGLSRALDVVEAAHPATKIKLTTDGHKSVAKWLREKKADRVTHHLDIWHVSKGLWKKLICLTKTFPLVGKWMKSIRSHLYWCALSSDGDAELMVAKWKSIVNHIANFHEHDDVLFPTCAHGKIHREWFDQASEEYDRISKILLATHLLHAVAKLSPDGQTSGLEGFHGTVIHFAPKMIHFGYNGMKTRTQIAALHFNENAGREQRVTKEGKPSEAVHFPKSKRGEYVVKEVKINPTYSYADKIAAEVESLVRSGRTYEIRESPPALCASYTHPDKNEAVTKRKAHRRYRKTSHE